MKSSMRKVSGGFLFVMCFAVAALARGTDDWKTFSPPSHEFKVLLPSPVKESKQTTKDGLTYDSYQVDKDGSRYTVEPILMVGSDFDDFVRGAKHGFDKSGTVSDEQAVSGRGWSGKRFVYVGLGTTGALLIAHADGTNVTYTLTSTRPVNDPITKAFFTSLEVNPKEVNAAHKDDSPPESSGYFIGKLVGYLLIPAALIAGVVVLITKKKPSNRG